MKTHLFLIIALVFLTSSLSAQDNKASVSLTAAIYEEEVSGNLDKAVELYLNILKKYPDDRPVAAKTLYRLGLVNEKMGKQKANEYFTRLVNTYPDQTEMVALAKARLAAFGDTGSAGGLVTRRVLADASDVSGVLTADGKYIIGIDWKTSDVIKFEVSSGNMSRITNIGGPVAKILYSQYRQQVFSRDGKQIAYDARTGWDYGMIPQLRIRNLDGSGLRSLYTGKSEKDSYILPLDWSPDAGSILALRRHKTNTNGLDEVKELILISTVDSSIHVLREIIAEYPLMTRARLSPDGRFVAFTAQSQGSPPHGDVFLMTVDGRNEVNITAHPAEDYLLAWTPDRKNLLFLSDRSGTWDIWTVRITDGKQQGEPELLKKNFGYDSEVLGFTPDGFLYYKTYTPLGGLYTGEVDLETGRLLVPPKRINTRYAGPPSEPKWSPDGKSLLYLSRRYYSGTGNSILTIRSAASGEERFLSPLLSYFGWPSWAPDGRYIISVGFSSTDGGIFRIDTETSGITCLAGVGLAPKLCPDGKTLVFVMDGGQIMRKRNLDTGEESEVVKTSHYFFDLSPDGREVVFQVNDTVKIVSLNKGVPRVLFNGLAKGGYDLRWTKDGRYIIARAGDKIWRVQAQGGTPLKLDLSIPEMGDFTLNPDNHRFAYSVDEGTKEEMWVMENFLSK